MDPEFWHQRWSTGRLGFHLESVNPLLMRFLDSVEDAGRRVLVPLAGKSRDVPWLAAQGYDVTAVEASPIAIAALHEEHGIEAEVSARPGFRRYASLRLECFEGDFFELPRLELAPFDWIWDRGAAIALPKERRREYFALLHSALRPGGRVLLVRLDYDSSRMKGPPFAIPENELEAALEERFVRTSLGRFDALADNPKFAQRGLTELSECVELLRRVEGETP